MEFGSWVHLFPEVSERVSAIKLIGLGLETFIRELVEHLKRWLGPDTSLGRKRANIGVRLTAIVRGNLALILVNYRLLPRHRGMGS